MIIKQFYECKTLYFTRTILLHKNIIIFHFFSLFWTKQLFFKMMCCFFRVYINIFLRKKHKYFNAKRFLQTEFYLFSVLKRYILKCLVVNIYQKIINMLYYSTYNLFLKWFFRWSTLKIGLKTIHFFSYDFFYINVLFWFWGLVKKKIYSMQFNSSCIVYKFDFFFIYNFYNYIELHILKKKTSNFY